MIGIIIFTDIKGSVLLWNKHKNVFFKKIITLNKKIKNLLNKYNGLLIKEIGDSCMIYFDKDKKLEALSFMIDIQKYLNETNFSIKNDKITIRIGCSYGKMNKKKNIIQKCNLLDFYGINVNTASRLESKICKEGGFAIYNIDILKYIDLLDINLKNYFNNNFIINKINKKIFKTKINKKRSSKLIYFPNKVKDIIFNKNLLYNIKPINN